MVLAPPNGESSPGAHWWRWLVAVYFLSGVTSLAYEVLWARMLSLQFGVSIFGIVITVSAFMAGLGLGSLAGARLLSHWGRPLFIFAALEGAVAAFALVTPGLFEQISEQLGGGALRGSLTGWYGLHGLVAFAVLFVPAFAMGAGFPLILRGLAGRAVSLATIYAVNTVGGACGALLPLWLLPSFGWTTALYVVVTLGVGVAVAAAVLGRVSPALNSPGTADRSLSAPASRPGAAALLVYAGLGAAALMLEVGWTRLFGMILLRTEYVLAIILAVYLFGIALGSLLGRRAVPRAWFTVLPILAGVFALASLWAVPLLARWAEAAEPQSLFVALLSQGLAVALLTFPATFILGAWLPLLTRLLAPGHTLAGAWLYGANAVGAALGAMLGGFVLLPWIGTAGTIVVAGLGLYAFGMSWAHSRWGWWAAPALLLLAWPVVSMPPVASLLPGGQGEAHDLFVHEDALAITHVVEQPDGQRLLLADLRRMDASSEPTAVIVQKNQARLPLLIHPAPHSVLFLGLGTGISASGAQHFPDLKMVGVEVSEGALLAARQWFAPVNGAILEQMEVVRDDARRYLRAHEQTYDVIVGDLFHPDLVGRGNLLSLQQFERARERLAPGGVFVQWVALNQFDRHSLELVLRTFGRAFPHGQMFVEGLRVALVGPKDPWPGARVPVLDNVARLVPAAAEEVTGGEGPWTWLGRYWGPVPAGEGPVQDEWWPRIEFRLPQVRYGAGLDLSAVLEYLLQGRPSLQAAAERLQVSAAQYPDFERAYVGTDLSMRSWLASLRGKSIEAQRLLRLAYEANPADRWTAFNLADQMMATLPQLAAQGRDMRAALKSILVIRPDHVGALRSLWRLEREEGDAEQADEYRARLLTLSPLDREAQLGM